MADNRIIDSPEALFYEGQPRWHYQPITCNFVPGLPEVYPVGRDNFFTIFCDEVIEYINEHLGENLSLADMASKLHISQYHFCRLFKQSTGMSSHYYLMQ